MLLGSLSYLDLELRLLIRLLLYLFDSLFAQMHTIVAAFLTPEKPHGSPCQRALALLDGAATVNKDMRLRYNLEARTRLLDAPGLGFEHQVDQQDFEDYEEDLHYVHENVLDPRIS